MLKTASVIIIGLCLNAATAIVAFSISSCRMKDLCSCVTNGGKLLSLKGMGHLMARDSGNKQDFRWSPCKTFNVGKLRGVTAVQHVHSTGDYYDIGTDPNVDFSVIGGSVVQLTMVSKSASRISFVNLTCSHGKTSKWIFRGEHPTNNYNFELSSPFSCPGYTPSDAKPLSTGSILSITFFVLLGVYVLVGVLFLAKVKKATGEDLIPNKTFWMGLPSLVKEGVQFVASCGGGRSAEYYSKI